VKGRGIHTTLHKALYMGEPSDLVAVLFQSDGAGEKSTNGVGAKSMITFLLFRRMEGGLLQGLLQN